MHVLTNIANNGHKFILGRISQPSENLLGWFFCMIWILPLLWYQLHQFDNIIVSGIQFCWQAYMRCSRCTDDNLTSFKGCLDESLSNCPWGSKQNNRLRHSASSNCRIWCSSTKIMFNITDGEAWSRKALEWVQRFMVPAHFLQCKPRNTAHP